MFCFVITNYTLPAENEIFREVLYDIDGVFRFEIGKKFQSMHYLIQEL
jgi:hypothetical protein